MFAGSSLTHPVAHPSVSRAGDAGADAHGHPACAAGDAGPARILHSWHPRRSRRASLLRRLGRRPLPFAGIVSLHASGRWSLAPDGRDRCQLAHVWDAGLWLTLRFHMQEGGKNGRRDITIWRFCLPEADWRMLRVQVARQAAMPGRALNKESA